MPLFQNARYPQGLTVQTAWLGIYQVLMWYEPVNVGGVAALPHIIDANNLRPPAGRPSPAPALNAWCRRAQAIEQYLAEQLVCTPDQVPIYLDRLMSHPVYRGRQRQNPLGSAFPALVKHALEQFGNKDVQYDLEVPATDVFPGVAVPGRSVTPKMDILVRRQGRPRAIVSAKWSLRHDRLNDISNECPVYKYAASLTRTQIDYIVVTNEFGSARLQRLLRDPCVDAVVHVHKPAVMEVCQIDGELDSLSDLTDLIARSHNW